MPERVLLYVEDDDAAFLAMQLTLEEVQAAIELHRAIDGEQALAFVRRKNSFAQAPRPDLIVLDLNLPKRSGMEVLAELKSDESLRSIPVIMFSSSRRELDENKSLQLGAQEYVTKPFSLDGLLETVKRAFSMPEVRSKSGASE
jgi:two-component system, chemotaxis family, response regulator Rcp1